MVAEDSGPETRPFHGIDNGSLVSLCRPHHRAVHEQGWRIRIAGGVAVVDPPP